MSLDDHINPLFDTISKIRRDIIRNIMPHTHKGSLALGPVLFFIEDSTQQCLYNWSDVSWEELSLGNRVKDILRDIEDITHFISKELKKFHVDKDRQESSDTKKVFEEVKSVNDWCKALCMENIEDYFDDCPVFELKFKEWKIKSDKGQEPETFASFDELVSSIKSCFESLKTNLSPNIYNELNETFQKSQHHNNIKHLPELLLSLFEISKGRYKAFEKLKKVFSEYSSGQLNEIRTLINNHPGLSIEELYTKDNKILKWDDFREKIKNYNPQNDKNLGPEAASSNYLDLIRYAIKIYNYLPQEIASSDAYMNLKEKNDMEYQRRSDKANIGLADLKYWPPIQTPTYDLTELRKNHPVYYVTHHFEKLFYQVYSKYTEKTSKIEHMLVLPVKLFDSQVMGQIIIISPEKINETDVINIVEAYLPKFQGVVKRAFDSIIVEKALEESEQIGVNIDEARYLASYLSCILSFQGLVLLRKDGESWALKYYTKREYFPKVKHSTLRVESVTSNIELEKIGLSWINSKKRRSALEINQSLIINLNDKESEECKSFKELLQSSKEELQSKSCLVASFGDLLLLVYCSENPDVLELFKSEIYMLIENTIEKVNLIKEKKAADHVKNITTQIAHDAPKALDEILGPLNDVILRESNPQIKNDLKEIVYLFEEFYQHLKFILAENHPHYRDDIESFKCNEIEMYDLTNEISNFFNKEVLSHSFITSRIRKIAKNTKRIESEPSYLLWKAKGMKFVWLKFEKGIMTKFNKKILHIILRGLFLNAFKHTDWDVAYKEKESLISPIIVEVWCENKQNIKLRMDNIPKANFLKRIELNEPQIFYNNPSVHLFRIGRAVEVGTGGKNIKFVKNSEFNNYLGVEVLIPGRYQR